MNTTLITNNGIYSDPFLEDHLNHLPRSIHCGDATMQKCLQSVGKWYKAFSPMQAKPLNLATLPPGPWDIQLMDLELDRCIAVRDDGLILDGGIDEEGDYHLFDIVAVATQQHKRLQILYALVPATGIGPIKRCQTLAATDLPMLRAAYKAAMSRCRGLIIRAPFGYYTFGVTNNVQRVMNYDPERLLTNEG